MRDFHRTPMGKTFYERTVPELVTQLARIAEALEGILAALAKQRLEKESRE